MGMRVLWVCNIMLPMIAQELGIPYSNKEGWLTGLSERILRDSESGVTLGVCFPYREAPVKGVLDKRGISYFGFAEDTVHEETYDPGLEQSIAEIMNEFQPDILHCFGTEYGHTLAAVRAFGKPEKTVIGMQGVCYLCAEHYLDGIPEKIAHRSLLRDYLKKDNLISQREKMKMRGEREKEALRLTGNVIGRTRFDRGAVLHVNPNVKYHFMNETMRSNFYGKQWELLHCEQHTVFVSQGNYPIKGLHFMLRALALLKKNYPDIHLYVAGDSVIREGNLVNQIKISSYGKYLKELIREGNLEEQVTFLGQLTAQQMCERYLKSHVFVSCSTIENSPNSVGEAMLLGVPVVSSEVGGVPDMLTDGVEGLLYTRENVSALATAVTRIFEDPDMAERLSLAARGRAAGTHDADANYKRLLEIYHDINLYQ